MSAPYVPCAPGVQTLISSQSAAATQGILYLKGECARVTVYFQGIGTTSSGVVTLEEAYYDADHGAVEYAGTWSTIQTLNASDVTGGKQQTVHITGSIWALRARISTVIGGGGTVSVIAWGN